MLGHKTMGLEIGRTYHLSTIITFNKMFVAVIRIQQDNVTLRKRFLSQIIKRKFTSCECMLSAAWDTFSTNYTF